MSIGHGFISSILTWRLENMPKVQIRKILGHLPRAIMLFIASCKTQEGEVSYLLEDFSEAVSSVLRFVDITVEIKEDGY